MGNKRKQSYANFTYLNVYQKANILVIFYVEPYRIGYIDKK